MTSAQDSFERNIEGIVQSMMPDRSRVMLNELTPGLTGCAVYKLEIVDEGGLLEIPRVLKVGDSRVIGDELHRYRRYVHHKPVGAQSQLDVAMCFPEMEWIGGRGEKGGHRSDRCSTAAIAYTFVGLDAIAIPWSEWAKTATADQLQEGIRRAMEHLSCWHRRGRQEVSGLGDMLATPSTVTKQDNRTKGREYLEWTVRYMDGIRKAATTRRRKSPSCIVHGDLHCDNLFALLGKDGDLRGKVLDVAIIDWGKVESGKYPSTDLGILLGDLAFRVGAITPESARHQLVQYAQNSGLDPIDAQIVYCFHLMRMLGWGPLEGKPPWISDELAKGALEQSQDILKSCGLAQLVLATSAGEN